jgi:recA bacterial DNA recombination protein
MASLSVQRLEALLQTRKLDASLTFRLPSGGGVLPTGIEPLDVRLGGGWPQGEVSELIGRASSGCTSVLVATLAVATRQGGLVGLVDTFDRFDPLSAARAGVDLDRVLWVRGPALTTGGRGACVDRAVLNGMRALDLIVRAGGFAVAALDLAETSPRVIGALPFTTWLRLAHVLEGRPTVCLLMGDAPMGRSARGRSVRFEARRCWSGAHAQSRRFLGFELSVTPSSHSRRA